MTVEMKVGVLAGDSRALKFRSVNTGAGAGRQLGGFGGGVNRDSDAQRPSKTTKESSFSS